jgi:5-methylthioadenosine/S-adenosylhomocysteine deaminase
VTPALTLIHNAVVVPVEPAGVFDRGWVRLADGIITALGAGEPHVGADDIVLDAGGDLLLPGFVSSHQHLLDVLLRGGPTFGPDFLEWLLGIYYGGIVHYSPDDAGLATYLAGAETLLAGVTCVVDNWGVNCGGDRGRSRAAAEASLESYRRLGLRVIFGRMFATQLPKAWTRRALPYDSRLLTAPLGECLDDIADLMDRWDGGGSGRIRVTPAPELVEMVGLDGVRAARELAEAHGVKMPIHLLTTPDSRGQHPAQLLADSGALSESVIAAHCTAATDDDLTVLRRLGVSVAHCPTSSAFFGGAVSIRRFLDAGLRVGLGSDNATLNCNSDILAEARRAALNAHLLDSSRPRLSGWEALRLATLGGAEAAGLQDQIGSIEPGKKADLVLLNVSGPHWYPRHDWAETLLFQGRAADVRTVLVDGITVVDDRRVTAGDHQPGEALGPAAQRASERIRERRNGRT